MPPFTYKNPLDEDDDLLGQPSYAQPQPAAPAAAPPATASQPADPTGMLGTSSQAPADPMTPSYEQTPAAPSTSAPPASPPATGTNYSQHLQQLQTATDPQQKALLQDSIARSAYTDLKNAGHDVQWQEDGSLLVDGRAYDVAGGSSITTPGVSGPSRPVAGETSAPPANGAGATDDFGSQIEQTLRARYGNDEAKIQSELDYFRRRQAEDAADYAREGKTNPHDTAYWVMRASGVNEAEYARIEAERAAAQQQSGATSMTDLGTTGLSYEPPPAASGPIPTGAPAGATSPTTYTPGPITFDDIPDFSLDDLLERAGSYTPGDLSSLDPSALDTQLTDAAGRLLSDPYSLSDRTIDTLKAKSKDELAEMQKADDDNLLGFSYANGIGNSRWLDSERAAGRNSRDRALIASNRDIDLTAAETRKADERAALEGAGSVAGQQFNQRLGAAGLRESSSQAAAASKQNALSTATQAVLQKSALTGDRMALRESVNQEAAKIGISAKELQVRMTIAQMQEATQRYGIDMDYDATMKQLSQRSREFAEDLALRWAQLGQQDAQFGAQFGLDAARFKADEDQRVIDNGRADMGL